MRLLKKSCLLVLGFAMLVLARPMSVSAATPDPVLEWVGIMTVSGAAAFILEAAFGDNTPCEA